MFILFLAIAANAFFAASEIAIISLNDAKVRRDADQGDKTAKVLRKFIDEPGRFLATIQVGVTLAGFLASAFAAVTFARPAAVWVSAQTWCHFSVSTVESLMTIGVTVLLAFLTLIFGELVPKRIAMQHSKGLAKFVSKPLTVIASVTHPFVSLLNFVTNKILVLFGIDTTHVRGHISEEEIRMMVDIGGENGSIEPQEKEMIENVFEFNNTTAAEIMVHRTDIVALSININDADCREKIRKCGLSRIPVYQDTIDDIQGILNTRDYLIKALDDQHPRVADLLRKPFFVPETIRTDILFRQMQKNKQSIAIVLDDSEQFHRPMTHDLLANVLDEVSAGKPGTVKIAEMRDGVFFASITAGDFVFDARPSDAIAAALRLEWNIECPEQLMDQVGVEVEQSETDQVEKFREFLDTVTPDDFENENP